MGQNSDRGSVIPPVKAFENAIFGPRTLGRTWGTRSIPSDFAMTRTPPGLGVVRLPTLCHPACPGLPRNQGSRVGGEAQVL
jgi:hypothetical protein